MDPLDGLWVALGCSRSTYYYVVIPAQRGRRARRCDSRTLGKYGERRSRSSSATPNGRSIPANAARLMNSIEGDLGAEESPRLSVFRELYVRSEAINSREQTWSWSTIRRPTRTSTKLTNLFLDLKEGAKLVSLKSFVLHGHEITSKSLSAVCPLHTTDLKLSKRPKSRPA